MDLVKKYDLDPQNIKLEITETAIVMDFKRQLELIERLRQTGFVVEMDDFGSGYSSLNMLKDIHVDVLKIDMAFLRKAKDEERSKKILQMIISLSKQLDMPVITEGVETAEQVAFLTEMGCDMFQGYYFARPMEVEKFEEFIIKMQEKETWGICMEILNLKKNWTQRHSRDAAFLSFVRLLGGCSTEFA